MLATNRDRSSHRRLHTVLAGVLFSLGGVLGLAGCGGSSDVVAKTVSGAAPATPVVTTGKVPDLRDLLVHNQVGEGWTYQSAADTPDSTSSLEGTSQAGCDGADAEVPVSEASANVLFKGNTPLTRDAYVLENVRRFATDSEAKAEYERLRAAWDGCQAASPIDRSDIGAIIIYRTTSFSPTNGDVAQSGVEVSVESATGTQVADFTTAHAGRYVAILIVAVPPVASAVISDAQREALIANVTVEAKSRLLSAQVSEEPPDASGSLVRDTSSLEGGIDQWIADPPAGQYSPDSDTEIPPGQTKRFLQQQSRLFPSGWTMVCKKVLHGGDQAVVRIKSKRLAPGGGEDYGTRYVELVVGLMREYGTWSVVKVYGGNYVWGAKTQADMSILTAAMNDVSC